MFISEPEVRERIERELGPLEPVDRSTEPGVGPAIVYRLAQGNPLGRIGFISAMSAPFCSTCNRMRLTADGRLHLCLLRDDEVDLRAELRAGATQARIEQIIRHAVALKPWGHGLPEHVLPTLRGMSQLGG